MGHWGKWCTYLPESSMQKGNLDFRCAFIQRDPFSEMLSLYDSLYTHSYLFSRFGWSVIRIMRLRATYMGKVLYMPSSPTFTRHTERLYYDANTSMLVIDNKNMYIWPSVCVWIATCICATYKYVLFGRLWKNREPTHSRDFPAKRD